MSPPDGPHEQDEPRADTVYYAIVTPGRTRANPAGLARRRLTTDGPVDESLHRDFVWRWSSELIEWEDGGDLSADRIEIGEAEANEIIEQFRSRWTTSDQ